MSAYLLIPHPSFAGFLRRTRIIRGCAFPIFPDVSALQKEARCECLVAKVEIRPKGQGALAVTEFRGRLRLRDVAAEEIEQKTRPGTTESAPSRAKLPPVLTLASRKCTDVGISWDPLVASKSARSLARLPILAADPRGKSKWKSQFHQQMGSCEVGSWDDFRRKNPGLGREEWVG